METGRQAAICCLLSPGWGIPQMNHFTRDLDRRPTRAEAELALATLRRWATRSTPEEVATLDPIVSRLVPGQEVSNYPALARAYPEDFEVDDAYRATMPDLQNGPSSLIRGAQAPDPACRHLEFPPADPLPHPRRRRSDARDQRHRDRQPRCRQEGHQHEPDHAVVLPLCRRDLLVRGDRDARSRTTRPTSAASTRGSRCGFRSR